MYRKWSNQMGSSTFTPRSTDSKKREKKKKEQDVRDENPQDFNIGEVCFG
jgi:hypothetical protein